MSEHWVLIGYGLLLLLGGILGFKKGSRVSLWMGLVSGSMILSLLLLVSRQPILAYEGAAGISGILTVVFGVRLFKTRKIMPSGLLCSVSLAVLIFSLTRIFF